MFRDSIVQRAIAACSSMRRVAAAAITYWTFVVEHAGIAGRPGVMCVY